MCRGVRGSYIMCRGLGGGPVGSYIMCRGVPCSTAHCGYNISMYGSCRDCDYVVALNW